MLKVKLTTCHISLANNLANNYLLQRPHMDSGCTRSMAVVRAIFNQDGWYHSNRIQDA
jgi:hypothetical protein